MNKKQFLFLVLTIGVLTSNVQAQIIPDTSKARDSSLWVLKNRALTVLDNGVIHLNAIEGDGLIWVDDVLFANGTIECDIKGKDMQGRSFVGVAFHIKDEVLYDAVYFRPFNFENPQRKNHSAQYISHPKNTWSYLRNKYPQKYEGELNVSVDPNDWFHVKIKIHYPNVEVFVNGSKAASLEIEQISSRAKGKVGFWVGHYSEGWFKNLVITKQD